MQACIHALSPNHDHKPQPYTPPYILHQAFMMSKLKIAGKMALAVKLPAVLEAAKPKSKL